MPKAQVAALAMIELLLPINGEQLVRLGLVIGCGALLMCSSSASACPTYGSRLILFSLFGSADVEALRVQILELNAGLVVNLWTSSTG